MRLIRVVSFAATLGILMASPLRAHHSFAPYEPTQQMKLSGVVTDFRRANPHVYIDGRQT